MERRKASGYYGLPFSDKGEISQCRTEVIIQRSLTDKRTNGVPTDIR